MSSSEQLVISATLKTRDQATLVKAGVTTDLFEIHRNEWKWISKRIRLDDQVPSVRAFKAQFPSFTVLNVDDLAIFITQLKEDTARARTTDLIDEALGHIEHGQVDKALEHLGTEMLKIQAMRTEVEPRYDMVADWDSTFEGVEKRVERFKEVGSAGVPTGFETLDYATGGLQAGWFCVVGGRLGHGKTWTMVRMACAAAMSGNNALYFSLEQSKHQIAMRSQAIFAYKAGVKGINPTDLMRGFGVDMGKYEKFLEEDLPKVVTGALWINDTTRGRVGVAELAAAIERDKPDIVFLDYITLMKMTGDGDWLSVASLSADLKSIAERYEIPIVGGSQLNRAAIHEDRPDPGNLSRSDSLGHDADLVVLVKKDKTAPNVMRLDNSKFRHGPDGQFCYAEFDPSRGVYEEISGNEAERIRERHLDTD